MRLKPNQKRHNSFFILRISLIIFLVGCTALPATPTSTPSGPWMGPTWSAPTEVIPTWSESDLSNYDPSPSSILLETDDYYMVIDQEAICNRLPDIRMWGDGRVIYSHYTVQGREVLEGHLAPESIKALLRSLQDLGFTGNYIPDEVIPAPS